MADSIIEFYDLSGDKAEIAEGDTGMEITFSNFDQDQVTLYFNHRHIRDFEKLASVLASRCPHERIKRLEIPGDEVSHVIKICLDCGKDGV